MSGTEITMALQLIVAGALMAWDRLRGKKTLILHVEEPDFIQHLLPVVKAFRDKTKSISYYIATDYMAFASGVPLTTQTS